MPGLTRSWWGADLIERRRPEDVWAYGSGGVSHGELRDGVEWHAQMMAAHGVRPGSTLAMQGTPSFTQLWTILGAWSLGVQVLLLEQSLGAEQRQEVLRRCSPQYLVQLDGPGRVRNGFVDQCESLITRWPGGRPQHSSHCLVQISSGTTGRAKVIGRTPESLLHELERMRLVPAMPVRGEQVALLEPMTRPFCLVGGVLHALAVGATVRFPRGGSGSDLAAAVAPADIVFGGPGHFGRLAEAAPPPPGRSALRAAVSSGEPLRTDLAEAFEARFGTRLGQAYGTTETGLISANIDGRYGSGSVGPAIPATRARVTDGVLEVHLAQSPYLDGATDWFGGWLSTLDLAELDPRTGALTVTGRADQLGRRDVDPRSVESVLRSHSAVTDAVVLTTEPIEAFVASSHELDGTDLQRWCERFLRESSVPVHYHVVRKLPRTPSGKLVRARAQLASLV